MFRPWIALALLAAVSGCGMDMNAANEGAPRGTGFMSRTLKSGGESRRYAVFVPHQYTPTRKWPAIVFLHGVLQAGSDGEKQLSIGLPRAIADNPSKFNFIAVFPQSPGDWRGESACRIAVDALAETAREFSVDPDRVTITGLSNGGHGSYEVPARHPGVFAASAPMCGHSDYDNVPRLTGLPIWVFHNSMDPLVSVDASREMVRRIKEAGGRIFYTEYQEFGHDCWTKAYSTRELYDWMEQQRRRPAGAAAQRVGG